MGALSDTHGMEARIHRPEGSGGHAPTTSDEAEQPAVSGAAHGDAESGPRLGGTAGNPPPLSSIFGEGVEQRLGGTQGRPPPLSAIFGDSSSAPRLGGTAGNPPPVSQIFGEEYASRLGGSQGKPPPLSQIFGEEYASRLGGSQGKPPPLSQIFGEEYASRLGGSQGRPPPLADIFGAEFAEKVAAKQPAAGAAGGSQWSRLLARAERSPPTSVDRVFHSVGKVKLLGSPPDLSARGELQRAVEARSFKRELILLSATEERLAEAINAVLQLRRLGFEHYLILGDVRGTCEAAQRAAPGAACAFASRATDGEEDVPAGVLEPHVRVWIQRRRVMARRPPLNVPSSPSALSPTSRLARRCCLVGADVFARATHSPQAEAARLGTNVLLADPGLVWFTSPYPGLKDPPPQGLAEAPLVVRAEGAEAPDASPGVLYAQRLQAGGAAEYAVAEPTRRALALVRDAPRALNAHYPHGEVVPEGGNAPQRSLEEGRVANDALESAAGGRAVFWRAVAGALRPSEELDKWANECARPPAPPYSSACAHHDASLRASRPVHASFPTPGRPQDPPARALGRVPRRREPLVAVRRGRRQLRRRRRLRPGRPRAPPHAPALQARRPLRLLLPRGRRRRLPLALRGALRGAPPRAPLRLGAPAPLGSPRGAVASGGGGPAPAAAAGARSRRTGAGAVELRRGAAAAPIEAAGGGAAAVERGAGACFGR